MAQLRSNHSFLNDTQGRLYHYTSADCSACNECECIEHFLFRCSRFIAQRTIIEEEFAIRGYLYGVANLHVILGAKLGNMDDMRFIRDSTYKYITTTGRFDEYLRSI